MKKLFYIIVMSLFCLSITKAYSQTGKIGYVDIFELFESYQKTKDYEKILEQKREEKIKESKLEDKKEELMKMNDRLELLKGEEKTAQQQQVQKAVAEYQKLQAQVAKELKEESDMRMQEILDDINSTVKDFAEKNGYEFILNKSSVIYGAESADLTKQILEQLNKNYKK